MKPEMGALAKLKGIMQGSATPPPRAKGAAYEEGAALLSGDAARVADAVGEQRGVAARRRQVMLERGDQADAMIVVEAVVELPGDQRRRRRRATQDVGGGFTVGEAAATGQQETPDQFAHAPLHCTAGASAGRWRFPALRA